MYKYEKNNFILRFNFKNKKDLDYQICSCFSLFYILKMNRIFGLHLMASIPSNILKIRNQVIGGKTNG